MSSLRRIIRELEDAALTGGAHARNRRHQLTDDLDGHLERIRAENAYRGVAAHVSDSTWVGQGRPGGWGDYTSRVNSSLAGQVNRYPVGYDPTIFIAGGR